MSRKKKNPADLSHRTLFFFKKIDLWLAATCFPPVFPENPAGATSKSCPLMVGSNLFSGRGQKCVFSPVFPENPAGATSKSCPLRCRLERLLRQIISAYHAAMVVCGNGLNRVKSHVERCGFKRRLSVAGRLGKLRFKTGA